MPDDCAPEEKVSSEDSLRWTVWPAQRRPHAAAACAALILAVSWYGYVSMDHWVYSVIALSVLTASLSGFLLPTKYEVCGHGVRLFGFLHSRSLEWDELRCFLRGPDFIALSATDPPTERSISRGLILRLSDNGDEVAAALAAHIREWKAVEDSTGGRK